MRASVVGYRWALLLLAAACGSRPNETAGGGHPSSGSGGGGASGGSGGAGAPATGGSTAMAGSGGSALVAGGAPGSSGAGAAGGASAGTGAVSGMGGLGSAGMPLGGAGAPVALAGAGGAGASAGAGGGAPLGSLTVSNLKIEANPRMTLSCYLSWTTSEPASSEVQFGAGAYALHIVDDALKTEHRIHVVGMHPETLYDLKAVSTSATATGSAEGEFTTGKLPANAPAKGDLVANFPEKMQRGWTLTNYFVGSFDTDPWYKNDWQCPIWGDADRLANGNVLVTAGVKSSSVKTRIFEVTRAGEVVWGIEWPAANNGSYRAMRISPPPATPLE